MKEMRKITVGKMMKLMLCLLSVGLSTNLYALKLDAGPDAAPPAPGWERLGANQIYEPGQNKFG